MIVATFHGPNHFVPNYDESTIEVFQNIGHAMSALFDRYDTQGKRPLPVRYLNGNEMEVPFPFVELGDSFECYKLDINWQSLVLRSESIEDALSAVHIGAWDYRLLLMKPFGASGVAMDDTVSVSVQKR